MLPKQLKCYLAMFLSWQKRAAGGLQKRLLRHMLPRQLACHLVHVQILPSQLECYLASKNTVLCLPLVGLWVA